MNILVTYQSKTGFTKKYAQWISEELRCDIKEISKVTQEDIKNHGLVIHGGWIMGGMINGLDKIRRFAPQKLIVFGVGFTMKEQMETAQCISANKLGNTPFFYYEGGMNPEKMGFMGKMIVRMVTKKSPAYADRTDQNEIKELVKLALIFSSEA